jgi:hypothetical protein
MKIKDMKINTRCQIIASKIQNILLKKLRSAHSIVIETLATSFKAPENYENKYLKFLANIKNSTYHNYDFHRRKLEVLFHQEIIRLRLTKILKSKTLFNLKNLSNTLYHLKGYIQSALLVINLF